MPSACVRRILVAVLVGLAWPSAGHAQASRDRTTPGLILDTGARTAACDVLTFTADGKYLLAAGDDKVVRIWRCEEAQLRQDLTLRWSIFREQRGSIYALALSPDATQVAIGGIGVYIGSSIAVLERSSGKVKMATTLPTSPSVRALVFSPSGALLACGKADGSVWLWDLKDKPRQLAAPRSLVAGQPDNQVRLLTFLGEKRLLAVAEDGKVLRWDLNDSNDPEVLFQFDTAKPIPDADRPPRLWRVAISPDQKWLAAAPSETTQANQVEIRSLDGQEKKTIILRANDFPHSLAFDSAVGRLAVGIRTYPQDAPFFMNAGNKVVLYDLKETAPEAVATIPATYHPEALAFQPRANLLAVAGGADHEVALWQLEGQRPKKVSEIRSPGNCLWGVGLSEDRRRLGYQIEMATDPADVNHRGTGEWRVFDLQQRRWVSDARNFRPVRPIATMADWKVDTRGDYTWQVSSPERNKYKLPLNRGQDAMPRCFTFLRPAREDEPIRLAVGHYYGVSIFELVEGKEPRRVRLYVGHEGEVMALAPSADGKMLVTASRDQTISAWSLADWPSQPELGARFVVEDGKVLVRTVNPGSPAWEANAHQSRKQDGLAEGDEIVLFAFNLNEFVFDPHNQITQEERRRNRIKEVSTSATACLERLQEAVPGKQFHFRVKRQGVAGLLDLQTTVRQRPVWRFFPMRDGEWVLWRWRDYYYDTSTHGDRYIGWQVSSDVSVTPEFYRAEQYRDRFHRPDKVQTVLVQGWENPDRVHLPDIEPPEVRLADAPPEVKDAPVKVTVTAVPHNKEPQQELVRAVLWVNDYRVTVLARADDDPQALVIPRELEVPADKLEPGPNTLILQVYNRAGGRGQARCTVNFSTDKPLTAPRLFGLAVGVNDYRKVQNLKAPGGGTMNLSCACQDADAIRKALLSQSGSGLFREVTIDLLKDEEVSPQEVLRRLKSLQKGVAPRDRVVLFLAGHGMLARKNKPDHTFVYICPQTNGKDLERTGLTGQDLHAALAEVPCRKLVMIDACHSAGAAVNQARAMNPAGMGCTVLAACDVHEESLENAQVRHGYFTQALLEALGAHFDKADQDGDRRLDFPELYSYVKQRVAELVALENESQNPKYYPRPLEPLIIAHKRPKP